MATLIAFSAEGSDYVLVAEPLDTVAEMLATNDGFIRLTLIPASRQRFEPGPTWINTARVAYVREPANPPSRTASF